MGEAEEGWELEWGGALNTWQLSGCWLLAVWDPFLFVFPRVCCADLGTGGNLSLDLQIRLNRTVCTARGTVKMGIWAVPAIESRVYPKRAGFSSQSSLYLPFPCRENVIPVDFYQSLFESSHQPASSSRPFLVGKKDSVFCFSFSPNVIYYFSGKDKSHQHVFC